MLAERRRRTSTAGALPFSLMPVRTTWMSRPTRARFRNFATMPRSRTCGCASACGTLYTGPAGTPAALRSCHHSSADLAASARFQNRLQLVAVREPRLPIREARVGDQVGASDDAAHRFVLLLLVGRDVQQAIAGPERPDGLAVTLSLPIGFGSRPGDEIVRDRPAHRRERGLEHRHIDEVGRGSRAVGKRGGDGNAAVMPPMVSAIG